MAEDLPDEFDLIVVGTGFPEACVAAAASRIGKTVLHIDKNEYYGGSWASFDLKKFNDTLMRNSSAQGSEIRNAHFKWHTENTRDDALENANENVIEDANVAKDAEDEANVNTDSNVSPSIEETLSMQEQLLKSARHFNIDLCPKVLYSNGKMVKLLISSNICRYAEFRYIDYVYARYNNKLLSVPCSRSDVFITKDLSLIEKRLIMKFLTNCLSYAADENVSSDTLDYRGQTFQKYLNAQEMTDKIRLCVMQAIAMCTTETPFEVGIANVKQFLEGVNRYGNTPFIFPMYGCGEMPQCFCRLCAVFGGVYCLNMKNIHDINVIESEHRVDVTIGEKVVKAKHIVCSHGNSALFGGSLENGLSRGVFITSQPLGNESFNRRATGGVSVMRLISEDEREAMLIQLSNFAGTCAKKTYLFHLTTLALSNNPEKDLEPFAQQVFFNETNPDAPKLNYSAYFTLTTNTTLKSNMNANVFTTNGPYYELDYDKSIEEARSVFQSIYPEAEFLPRAPDPEEIVVDGEDPRALNEVALPEDLRQQLLELKISGQYTQ